MRVKQLLQAAPTSSDAERTDLARQPGLQLVRFRTLKRYNPLLTASQRGTTSVCSKLALAATSDNYNGRQKSKHDLGDDGGYPECGAVPVFRFENKFVHQVADDPGQGQYERVDHAWIRASVTISPLATWLTSLASTASASSAVILSATINFLANFDCLRFDFCTRRRQNAQC